MMSKPDYMCKQTVFVFASDGDRISLSNDNLVVTGPDGKVKVQSSCYRISSLFVIGNMTVTTPLIRSASRFGFPIVLMTTTFRVYDVIGHRTEGNTELRRLQYSYDSLDIARRIVANKISNQAATLRRQTEHDRVAMSAAERMDALAQDAAGWDGDLKGLMGIEGTASRAYFKGNFNTVEWKGRRPRIKSDHVNSTLDIGYTMLFNMIDSMLNLYGFDTYVGVYHKEYYMRKSLTCDIMEPFRPLIDWTVRKAVNLGQCKPEHFNVVNGRYLLDIRHNKDYVSFLMKPLLESREEMFVYVQRYYRFFMGRRSCSECPEFRIWS